MLLESNLDNGNFSKPFWLIKDSIMKINPAVIINAIIMIKRLFLKNPFLNSLFLLFFCDTANPSDAENLYDYTIRGF